MLGFLKNPDMIECSQAREMVANGAQLVDVRSPQEFAQGAIPGSINVPLQMIQMAHAHLKKDRPVIVYCVSGARSAQAQMFLENMGFDAVHNLGSIRKYLAC
jgi:phage shock protein E